MTLKFSKFELSDVANISHLQPETWPDIVAAFKEYCELDFCRPMKVSVRNKIIGLGVSNIFGKNAWLAHIIVQKEHRNKGIGRMIVDYLLEDLKSYSLDTVSLIATDLGAPVYLKAGFKVVTEYAFFTREKDPEKTYRPKHIKLFDNHWLQALLSLDKLATGEDRSALLKKYAYKSYILIEEDELQAFYIPGLCEGPIISKTEKSGLEMLRFKHNNINKAVLAPDNITAVNFLKDNNFSKTNTSGIRMIMGKEISWQAKMIFSRIGGNFG